MFNGGARLRQGGSRSTRARRRDRLNGTPTRTEPTIRQRAHLRRRPRAVLRADRMGHPSAPSRSQARRASAGGAEREAPERERALRKGVGLSPPGLFPRTPPTRDGHRSRWRNSPAAKLDDVEAWFQTTTAPPMPRSSWAGDIDGRHGEGQVERTSDTSRRAAGDPQETWIAKRTGSQRASCRIACRRPVCTRSGTCPNWGSADGDTSGWRPTARTPANHRACSAGWCTTRDRHRVDASATLREIGGLFTTRPASPGGGSGTGGGAVIDEELAAARDRTTASSADGPRRSRAPVHSRVERIGGFGGKSECWPRARCSRDSRTSTARSSGACGATRAQVRAAACAGCRTGLHARGAALPEYSCGHDGGGPVGATVPGTPPAAAFPELVRDTLSTASRSCWSSAARFRSCASTCARARLRLDQFAQRARPDGDDHARRRDATRTPRSRSANGWPISVPP